MGRGRDFILNVLAKANQFDLRRPAKEVDDLGNVTKDTGRKIDTLNDRLDKSNRSLRKTGDSAKHAEGGMKEFKDETASTGREAAASFQDIESAADALQETLANAFAGFGKLGGLIGGGAAVGVGLLINKFQTAADKANALKDRIIDMSDQIVEAGGNIANVDIGGIMQDWANQIADNKSWWEFWQESNTTNLEKVQEAAKQTGIDFELMFKGMSGIDSAATQELLDELNAKLADTQRQLDDASSAANDYGMANTEGTVRLLEQRDALVEQKDAAEKSLKTNQSLKDMADAKAEAYGREAAAQALLKSALDSTATSQDDYATAVEASGERQITSIDAVIAAQKRDLENLAAFQANTEAVYNAVGQAGVDWANEQGPNAAAAMALLAKAPAEKQAEIVANYERLHGNMDRAMSGRIDTPLGTSGDPYGEAALAYRRIQTLYRTGVNLSLNVSAPDFYATVARYKREAAQIARTRN